MAEISCDKKSSVEDYGVDMGKVYFRGGAFGRIGKSKDKSLWDQFDPVATNNLLQCHHDVAHWRVNEITASKVVSHKLQV